MRVRVGSGTDLTHVAGAGGIFIRPITITELEWERFLVIVLAAAVGVCRTLHTP